MRAPLRLSIAACLVAASALGFACDEPTLRFSVKVAPDFAPRGHAMSVLGVYRSGRMSADGWQLLGPALITSIGARACPAGYDQLAGSNESLAEAVEDYAEANGPTDDLLAQLAPAAKGDVILVLTVEGHVATRSHDAGAPRSAPPPNAAGRGGSRMGMGRGAARMRMPGGPGASAEDADRLELSALVYSVRAGKSVAAVTLRYSGTSLDEAVAEFARKVAEALPGSTCATWDWDAHVDRDRIHQLVDE